MRQTTEVEIVSVGTELVLGRTLDTNAHWLSERLAAAGLPVTLRTTVGDEGPRLAAVLRRAARRSQVVIVTGGLGPTRDDLTRRALAAAAGVQLRLDSAARGHIARLFRRWGRPMSPANEVQALVPEGGRAIENPHGTAPGIEMRIGAARVFALPGVPREMEAMFEAAVLPRLEDLAGGAALVERRVRCFGAGESVVGERLHDLMDQRRNPRVSTRVADGVVTVRVLARGPSPEEARNRAERTEREVRRRLGRLAFGTGDDTLEGVVAGILIERRLTLAVAESVTGGLLAHRLTNVPGISASLLSGVTAYGNRAKTDLLGVPPALIETAGAVSAEVAGAMAAGARERAGSDLALSTTGIAGPGGATPEKPVGLVYIGLAHRAGTSVERRLLHGDRLRVKERAASAALDLLRLHLLAEEVA